MLFQCPKLTPLQSRFVASFGALLLLGFIYWSLSNPHFAYAAELEVDGSGQSRGGEDHNWHRIEQERLESEGIVVDRETDGPELSGRAEAAAVAVASTAISANNAPDNLNILAGNTSLWLYPSELLSSPPASIPSGLPSEIGVKRALADADEHAELRKRQSSSNPRTIYVSINTCKQPTWNGTGTQTAAPPQLTLYLAAESGNSDVGPGSTSQQIVQSLSEGFANTSVTTTSSGDWYIAVHAPPLPDGFVDVWNYELAVSHDGYYHRADQSDPLLHLVDTDTTSALLVTDNLTVADASSPVFQKWMELSTPFTMFAANVNHTAMMGLSSSYCGWSNSNQIAASQSDAGGNESHVQMGMITRGLGNKPKQQFYVTNLNSSSSYYGVLAQPGNSTASGSGVVGGGGKIWQTVTWPTKVDGNCALMFNMSFCNEVAYAVPSNSDKYNIFELRGLYDNYTSSFYQQFNYSLQQIPCDTTSDAQYSTVKTCADCAAAYKEWLCAVSIPRCDDFSNNQTYLQPRNMGQAYPNNTMLSPDVLNRHYVPMSRAPTLDGSPAYQQTYLSSLATNSSRNPTIIDDMIQPGPYRELLPCDDLCYSLMQSCPAALGFGCPYPGRGLEAGYGQRSNNGTLTCSFLGAVYEKNGAPDFFAPVFRALLVALLAALLLGVA